MTTISKRTRILLLCNAEHGQANIQLAIAHELLRKGNVNVHVCSFPNLRKRFERQLFDHRSSYGAEVDQRAFFHNLTGPTVTEVFLRCGKRGPFHTAGLSGCIEGLSNVFEDYWGWTESEYIATYWSCANVLESIDPNLIVVDYFFLPGRDAVQNQNRRYCLMNTTSLSHIVLGSQQHYAYLWKYPMVGTGYSYPLPPHLVPTNAIAAWKCTQTYRNSKQRRLLSQWRKKHNIRGRFPFADAWRPDRFHLSPSLPELDWPMKIPGNVLGCGPILLPTRAVNEQDPELEKWLSRGPTVLVNLGTLFAVSAEDALNIARAVRSVLQLDTQQKTQILWKLQKHPDDVDEIFDDAVAMLQPLMKQDRVRISSWLNAEPLALLQTGSILCSVHHGGANSFFEAVRSGVPQVVLPAWQDCYENAARAEWLQIGVHANKRSAPHIDEEDLTRALRAVLEDEGFENKARVLAQRLPQAEGRTIAAEYIMNIAKERLRPENVVLQDTGAVDKLRPEELSETCNENGDKLTTSPQSRIWRFPGYLLLQDVLMAVHVLAMWWMPLLAIGLLLLPSVRIPWLICMGYSLFTARHGEQSSFPLYYHLIRGTRIWEWYKAFYTDYYPVKLYRTCPLPPTRKYIFGYHPHGIGIRGMGICFGMQACGFPQLFPKLRTTFHVTSDAFKVPLWKTHLQLMGCKSVSLKGCMAQLTSGGHDGRGMGNGIVISVGGRREAERARPNSMDVVVKIRKGFIRLAVETGADIVPVIGFGENDIWERPENTGTVSQRILKFLCRFPPHVKLHEGRFSIVLPFRKPIDVIVGAPIAVQQSASLDEAYVDRLQAEYVTQLQKIWNDWRDHFNVDKSVEFRMVE